MKNFLGNSKVLVIVSGVITVIGAGVNLLAENAQQNDIIQESAKKAAEMVLNQLNKESE